MVLVHDTLDELAANQVVTAVIHGGANGVDYHAAIWARTRKREEMCFPADWAKHGRAAGPIRNQQMLDEGAPAVVVAFPGGKGTKDMVQRAKKAGTYVIEVRERRWRESAQK